MTANFKSWPAVDEASVTAPVALQIEPHTPETRKLRLLFLSLVLPCPPMNGLKMRVLALLTALGRLGHEIHLVSFHSGETCSKEVSSLCRTVTLVGQRDLSEFGKNWQRIKALPGSLPSGTYRYRSGAMKRTIANLLRNHKFDAVVVDAIDSAVNMGRVHLPVIVDDHNAEHLILKRFLENETRLARRLYAWIEYYKLRAWEQRVCAASDLVMVCSDYDESVLRQLSPGGNFFKVPNAVDTAAYFADWEENGTNTVIYTGGMDWFPNEDAVLFFADHIFPRIRSEIPTASFVVAGRNPSAALRDHLSGIPGVRVTGTVEDIRPEICKAAISVVPLRMGSGTRLKILEAAALAKPIVSTSLGAEGLEFVDDCEIKLADSPETFAGAVVRLLGDPKWRKSMGSAARERVKAQYSFEALASSVEVALQFVQVPRLEPLAE